MIPSLTLEPLMACGVEASTATTMLALVNQWLQFLPAPEVWQRLTQEVLRPEHPFELHHLLYQAVYADWDGQQGPPPAWLPTEAQVQATHIAALMRQLGFTSYAELQAWSARNRSDFWDRMIQRLGIRFRQPYRQVVDLSDGIETPQWLPGARFNIVESCFQAPADAPAVLFQSETGPLTQWSYRELQTLTYRVANSLVAAGFQPGDAIAIDMPMTAEAVAIYLGIIAAGCVVVSIADSFAAPEIAARLQIANAKGIFTQTVMHRAGKLLPLYEKVVAAQAPRAIVLSQGDEPLELRSGDIGWSEFLSANDQFESVVADPSAHTNILFSSGTTGSPKAIPWTQTTPIKCAVDAHLHQDIHPGEVVAWPTSLGWMMGPWLIYASLVNQATIALYGGVPTQRGFGQFVQDAQVNLLGVVPSLVSLWKATGCMQGLNWSAIKAFSSTGECSNPQDMLFLMALAGYKPVIEYCGGTEIGGGYITGTLVQPAVPATFSTAALGLDFVILDEKGQPANTGEVFIIPPSIGLSQELLNRDHHQVYFAHTPDYLDPHHLSKSLPLRRHGDRLERLPQGYYRAQGRVDDTMNLGGIKVSAVEIEQAINTVETVREAVAIAPTPPDGGPSQLVICVVMDEPSLDSSDLKPRLQQAIAQHLNPLFKIHDVVVVDALPRTASNKVMRRVLRDRYQTK